MERGADDEGTSLFRSPSGGGGDGDGGGGWWGAATSYESLLSRGQSGLSAGSAASSAGAVSGVSHASLLSFMSAETARVRNSSASKGGGAQDQDQADAEAEAEAAPSNGGGGTGSGARSNRTPPRRGDGGSSSLSAGAGGGDGGGATVLEAALTSAKACMGTGALALPYAAAGGGIAVNLAGLALFALWNLRCVGLLLECGDLVPGEGRGVCMGGPRVGGGAAAGPPRLQPPPREGRLTRRRRTLASMRRLFRRMSIAHGAARIDDAELERSLAADADHHALCRTSGGDDEEEEGGGGAAPTPHRPFLSDRDPPPPGTLAYGRVAWYALGPVGLQCADWASLLLFLGVAVSYEAMILAYLAEVPLSTGSRAVDALATVAAVAPLTCARDLGFLARPSAAGLAVLSAAFVVIFAQGLATNGLEGLTLLSGGDLWPSRGARGLAEWFGVTSFGFGIVPLTFNIRASMGQPERMPRAAEMALGGVAAAYAAIGTLAVVVFRPTVGPDGFRDDILTVLPDEGGVLTTVRLAMVASVIVSVPLLLVPCAEIIEGRLGVTAAWHPERRIAIRTVLSLLCALVALLVPSFVQVISFVGAFCTVLTSFIFPPLFHLELIQKRWDEDGGVRLFQSDEDLGGVHEGSGSRNRRGMTELECIRKTREDVALLILGVLTSTITSALILTNMMR